MERSGRSRTRPAPRLIGTATVARILVSGTLAYDMIGGFATRLDVHPRNVKLDSLIDAFGGCAMNIAYNLSKLGHEPVPFAYVGEDFTPDYEAHLQALQISQEAIIRVSGSRCARGIILTDARGAQFTAFHPGPTGLDRYEQDAARLAAAKFDALIVAPDLPEKMLNCARWFRGVSRRVWCPGQYAEMLTPGVSKRMLEATDMLIVNRHEWDALHQQVPIPEISRRVSQIIITDGAQPVTLLHEGLRIPVPETVAIDPTGCGDAFAAALVAATLDGKGPSESLQSGIGQALLCLRAQGSQQH